MNDDRSDFAARFVLGLMAAPERDALARAAEIDPAVAGEIDTWNESLAPLAGDDEVAPPGGLFDRIQAAITARSQLLPGTLTVRAGQGVWETIAAGVERKMLWNEGPNGRVTFLVRLAPGARFDSHEHADDEECYVVDGEVRFDTLTLRAGDYHLARRGMTHPAAVSERGCTLLVTAAAA
jgi:quercetin dioxygenase-like cupin family protein